MSLQHSTDSSRTPWLSPLPVSDVFSPGELPIVGNRVVCYHWDVVPYLPRAKFAAPGGEGCAVGHVGLG